MKNYIFSVLLFSVMVIFSGGMNCGGTTVTNPPGETGTGGLILGTTDGGLTWDVNIHSNLTSVTSVSCLSFDPNVFCVAGRTSGTESKILRTTDFGKNLNVITQPPDIDDILDITNTSTDGKGFAVGTRGNSGNPLQTTTDDGVTWVSGQTINHNLWAIDFGEDNGIILPQQAVNDILLSSDEGSSWVPRDPITPSFYINAVKFTGSFQSRDAIACGNNGKIFRTESAGQNWTEVTSPVTNQNFNDVDFIDPVGIIVGDNGTILRTADGGYFWQVVSSGVTNKLNRVYLTGLAYYIAGEGVLLRSTNQGTSWSVLRTAPNQNYSDMFFIKNTGVVVGSTHQ